LTSSKKKIVFPQACALKFYFSYFSKILHFNSMFFIKPMLDINFSVACHGATLVRKKGAKIFCTLVCSRGRTGTDAK